MHYSNLFSGRKTIKILIRTKRGAACFIMILCSMFYFLLFVILYIIKDLKSRACVRFGFVPVFLALRC